MKLFAASISGRVFKHPDKQSGVILSSLHGLAIQAQGGESIYRYNDDGFAYSAPFREQYVDIHITKRLSGSPFCLEKGVDYLLPSALIGDLGLTEKYAIYFNSGESGDQYLKVRTIDENCPEKNYS